MLEGLPFTKLRLLHIFIVIIAISVASTEVATGDRSKNNENSSGIAKVNIGVYWDSLCSNAVTSIDWGSLTAGNSKTITVFVRNEGSESQTLSLSAQRWNPKNADSCFSLYWNRERMSIEVNAVVEATLTLTASSNVKGITTFSFTTIITGTRR